MVTRRDKETQEILGEILGVDRARAQRNIRRKRETEEKGHGLLIH